MNVSQGYFSILRYRADAVRDESKNLGVVLVDADGKVAKIRHLSASSMPDVVQPKGIVYNWLEALEARCERGVGLSDLEAMSNELWDTIVVTKPKRTAVLDDNWDNALLGLWKSFAAPPPGGGMPNMTSALASKLRSEIKNHKIYQDHPLKSNTTGIPRRVTFFANSGTNIGLDCLKLALKREEEIYLRADAEANKVRDILSSNPVQVYVLCDFSKEKTFQEVNKAARAILQTARANVIETVAEAERVLVSRH